MISTPDHKQLKAVTLVEVILAIAVMAILVGVSLPITQNLLFQDELASTVNLSAKSLRAAQQFSMNGNSDGSWGVYFQTGSIIEFKGSSYALRDSAYDAVIPVNSRISFGGTTEFVFSRLTGTPATGATLNVIENGTSKAITVNAKGLVSY